MQDLGMKVLSRLVLVVKSLSRSDEVSFSTGDGLQKHTCLGIYATRVAGWADGIDTTFLTAMPYSCQRSPSHMLHSMYTLSARSIRLLPASCPSFICCPCGGVPLEARMPLLSREWLERGKSLQSSNTEKKRDNSLGFSICDSSHNLWVVGRVPRRDKLNVGVYHPFMRPCFAEAYSFEVSESSSASIASITSTTSTLRAMLFASIGRNK